MRIAIVGAGAIGTWFGARLAKAGMTVSVLARNQTLAAISADGMQVVSAAGNITAKVAVSDRAGDLGPQDLVIVALKGPALVSAAASVAELLERQTAVLSAMNGIPWWFFHGLNVPADGAQLRSVDPEGAIATSIPPEHVIGCVVHASCSTLAPGRSAHKGGNTLVLGEPSGATTDRLERVAEAFRAAGFDISVGPQIQQEIWYKLWGNMTMNPISALTGATADRILDDPLIRNYILRVMAEAADIGGRIGCPINQSGEERNRVTRELGAFRTSMLQDVEAGHALELDAFLGAPREIGRSVRIETPNMDALHGIARLFASVRGLNP